MAGSSVEYNFFGNSGLKVPNLCLGAGTFGSMKESEGPMGVVGIKYTEKKTKLSKFRTLLNVFHIVGNKRARRCITICRLFP